MYVVPLVLVSSVFVIALFESNARGSARYQRQVRLEKLVDIQSAQFAESLGNTAVIRSLIILTALLTDPDNRAARVFDDCERRLSGACAANEGETARIFAPHGIYYGAGGQELRIGSPDTAQVETGSQDLAREGQVQRRTPGLLINRRFGQ